MREPLVTRPTRGGSGLPYVVERATLRAHADMDIANPPFLIPVTLSGLVKSQRGRIEKGMRQYTHPEDIYRCNVPTTY